MGVHASAPSSSSKGSLQNMNTARSRACGVVTCFITIHKLFSRKDEILTNNEIHVWVLRSCLNQDGSDAAPVSTIFQRREEMHDYCYCVQHLRHDDVTCNFVRTARLSVEICNRLYMSRRRGTDGETCFFLIVSVRTVQCVRGGVVICSISMYILVLYMCICRR